MIARVYAAISAVTQAFAAHGIAKTRINLDDDYAYRSIDDVLDRLAPLLATHKLCVLPRVLEREASERTGSEGEVLTHVAIRAAFDLVSAEDGSSHTIEAYGEALDPSDKATAKAMTSAYKAAVLQAFCVPVWGSEDGDQRSPRFGSANGTPAQAEGWGKWAEDLSSVIASCMSRAAIDRLLAGKRAQLAGLARECPEHYAALGQAIARRQAQLDKPADVSAARADTDQGSPDKEQADAAPAPLCTKITKSAKSAAKSNQRPHRTSARQATPAIPAEPMAVAHG